MSLLDKLANYPANPRPISGPVHDRFQRELAAIRASIVGLKPDWEKLRLTEEKTSVRAADVVDHCVKPLVDRFLMVAENLTVLDRLPLWSLVSLRKQAKPLRDLVGRLLHYTPDRKSEQAAQQELERITDLAAQEGAALDAFLTSTVRYQDEVVARTLASELSAAKQGFVSTKSELAKVIETANSVQVSANKLLGQAKITNKKAEDALAAVREAVVQQGISRQGQAFAESKQLHKSRAFSWAIAASGIALVLLLSVVQSVHEGAEPPLENASWMIGANLGYFGVRILLVSLLSFLMVTCIRNYRAAMHNHVADAHRWRALSTFEQFKSGADDVVQDAVLLQAMEAIFANRATGYDAPDVGGGTHVTELLRVLKGQQGGAKS